MITIGIALIAVGIVAGVAPLWTIGVLLLGTGIYVAILGSRGHDIGGRRHYF